MDCNLGNRWRRDWRRCFCSSKISSDRQDFLPDPPSQAQGGVRENRMPRSRSGTTGRGSDVGAGSLWSRSEADAAVGWKERLDALSVITIHTHTFRSLSYTLCTKHSLPCINSTNHLHTHNPRPAFPLPRSINMAEAPSSLQPVAKPLALMYAVPNHTCPNHVLIYTFNPVQSL